MARGDYGFDPSPGGSFTSASDRYRNLRAAEPQRPEQQRPNIRVAAPATAVWRRRPGSAPLMKKHLASEETAGENHPASKNKDEKQAINM